MTSRAVLASYCYESAFTSANGTTSSIKEVIRGDYVTLAPSECFFADQVTNRRRSVCNRPMPGCSGGSSSQAFLMSRAEMALCKAANRSWLGVRPRGIAVLACQYDEDEAAFSREDVHGVELVVLAFSEDGRHRDRWTLGWLTPAEVLRLSFRARSKDAGRGGRLAIMRTHFRTGVVASIEESLPRSPVAEATKSVDLEGSEEFFARTVATSREFQNILQNRRNAKDLDEQKRENQDYNVMGARGEAAVAKAFDMYWSGYLGDHAAPDVGGLCVRTSRSNAISAHPYRTRDRDDDVIVMVQERLAADMSGGTLVLRGWLHGYEAKDMRWFRKDIQRPCNRVPFSAARPLNTIPDPTKVEAIRRWR